MPNSGFVNPFLSNSNKFYAVGFKQFNFQKKLVGTKVIVRRIKDDSEFKQLLGPVYTSTSKAGLNYQRISGSRPEGNKNYQGNTGITVSIKGDDNQEDNSTNNVPQVKHSNQVNKEYEEFEYVVIINLNDMKDKYLKTTEPIEFYDNEDKIKKGDLLIFVSKNTEYKFKVSKYDSFSEAEGVLNRYQLIGLPETVISE